MLTFAACGIKQVQVDLEAQVDASEVSCVAVAPFNNYSKGVHAGHIAAELVGVELLSRNDIDVITRADVVYALNKQNINLSRDVTVGEAIWLGEMLGADAVLTGSVGDFGYDSDGIYATGNPFVLIHAKLVSLKSKEIVWSGRVARSGEDLFNGKRNPLTRVAAVAVEEMLVTLKMNNKKSNFVKGRCKEKAISIDVDNDGILNLADECPTRPENFNGIDDSDGCPEINVASKQSTPLINVRGDRIVLEQSIRFTPGKPKLQPGSFAVLRLLAKFLKDNPTIKKIMVEGFVDEGYRSAYRERFAFQRAAAVKEFLVRLGIQEDRLIAVGYGLIPGRQGQVIEFTIVD